MGLIALNLGVDSPESVNSKQTESALSLMATGSMLDVSSAPFPTAGLPENGLWKPGI